MLKLHRLELSGFKSFVDPASLEFAGGLTAIVGPNGCGKSNLADAMVWVLGERSAKALRGETMDDVIFKGSRDRKPLGMAEVTLELVADDPGFPHVQDGKITISRRVFRSGESRYRINGRTVRLKDVQDLLMDTGLGIRAYAVIEQGRIGQILSGRPQERRRLIEEAAGITRYKQRKRIAEVKLEEARGNLERLDDILSEVERSLRSLKRQASAARRYQEQRTRFRDLLRQILLARATGLRQQLTALDGHLDEIVAAEAEAVAALHRDEADLAARREGLEAVAATLSERHRKRAELAAAIEGKQEFVRGARERLEEIAERVAAGEALAARRAEEIERLQASLEDLDPRRSQLTDARGLAAQALTEDEQRIARAESAVRRSEGLLEEARGRLLASLGEVNTLRNRLHREQMEAEKGEYRLRHLGEELASRDAALEGARAAALSARERAEGLERALQGVRERAAAARADLADLETRRQATAERHEALRERLGELRQRQRLLGELAEADSERRQRLRAVLEEAGTSEATLLADRVKIPAGWEGGVDLYLGNLGEAVVLPSLDTALALADALAEGAGGGRLLVPGETPAPTPPVDDPAIQAALGAALGLPDALAAALPPAYLVDSREDAIRLARLHPGVAFISRQRLWAQGGCFEIAGRRAQPGALARGAELAELERELSRQTAAATTLTAELQDLEAAHRGRTEALATLDEELARLERELAVASARSEDATATEHRLAIEHRTLSDERQELERELRRMAAGTEQLAAALAAAEKRHAELETAFDSRQKEVETAREAREAVRTTGVSRRGQLELLDQRLESVDRDLDRTREAIADGEAQIAGWREEATRLAGRDAEIRQAIAAAEEELQAALEGRATAEAAVHAAEEELARARAGVRELEEAVAAKREGLEEVRATLSERRVERASLAGELEHVAASYREEFREELPEPAGDPPPDLTEREAELERVKATLERLGPVNELAAQEFDEERERHAFLTAQRQDIVASIDSLRKTIREINVTSSQRFQETFERVNEAFAETFRVLFRGGEASMRLQDEEDVLETGIEIVARPPGKRWQNIMLLSGGEKALAAIALLFALFRIKPSPFCILDEVDAPLDDLNTLRFVDMLRDYAEHTQFIVITHNKLTMEACSLLYGVTMEEKGVSKTVAVEIDTVQPPARAAAG